MFAKLIVISNIPSQLLAEFHQFGKEDKCYDNNGLATNYMYRILKLIIISKRCIILGNDVETAMHTSQYIKHVHQVFAGKLQRG